MNAIGIKHLSDILYRREAEIVQLEQEVCQYQSSIKALCAMAGCSERELAGWIEKAKNTRATDPVKEAALLLVKKLDEVHNSPVYQNVWCCAQNHQGPYDGPQYAKELDNLEKILGYESERKQHEPFNIGGQTLERANMVMETDRSRDLTMKLEGKQQEEVSNCTCALTGTEHCSVHQQSYQQEGKIEQENGNTSPEL